MAKTGTLLAVWAFTALGVARADFTREYLMTGGLNSGQVWSGRLTVMVKGDRLARYVPVIDLLKAGSSLAEIIDLQQGTFTEINFRDKTYSVSPIADIAQAMEQARQKGKAKKPVIEDTDQTRKISGFDARMRIQKSEVKNYGATTELWLAPAVPGHQEEIEFQKRMCRQSASYAVLADRDVCEETSKVRGMPVLVVTKTLRKGKGPGDKYNADVTLELTGFSSNPVDAAKFEVPTGFRKVSSRTLRQLRK